MNHDIELKKSIIKKLNTIYCLEEDVIDRIILDIHPSDTMYVSNNEHYFSVGFSAIEVLRKVLHAANKPSDQIKSILDFPCGSGRVLRFLRAYFDKANITGSEIYQEYLKFCTETFGINTFSSGADFKEIKVDEKFDLIWCGSLITHLTSPMAIDLLQLFSDVTAKDGIMVFSSHGRTSLEWLVKVASKEDSEKLLKGYRENGYGYYPYPSSNVYGMPDSDYGMSVIKSSWMFDYLESTGDWEIVLFAEKLWDNNHDIFACRKK